MTDYVLDILFDTADEALEERILSQLYLTKSTGSTSDANGIYAWFDTPEDREEGARSLEGLGAELRFTDRDRIDWLEHYQQSLEALSIGRRFVVAPDAALLPGDDDRLRLVVPQEQAFGTGSHETTSLCIELLEGCDLRERRGLDVGSGSGILAMAMLRLGALRAIAFDNDPDTYGALRDNRMRNGIKPSSMPLFIGPLEALRGGTFDVITMNILPEVVMAMLPQVVGHLRRDGSIIASGILISRAPEVLQSASAEGLTLARHAEKGEWWAGELRFA